jgi:hypothetical protein
MRPYADKKRWAYPVDWNRCIWRSHRLVRDLGPVVEVAALPVLDPRQDLPLGRAIALELIAHDDTGNGPLSSFLKKTLDAAHPFAQAALVLRRLSTRTPSPVPCWSSARQRRKEGNAPEIVALAADADDHLVQVPLDADASPAGSRLGGAGAV